MSSFQHSQQQQQQHHQSQQQQQQTQQQQPFYGVMGFQYPPQQPAPPPPGGAPDPRLAPPSADAYHYNNTNLPGLNYPPPAPAPAPAFPPAPPSGFPQYWQQNPFPAQGGYHQMPFPPPFLGPNGVPIPPPPPPPTGTFYPPASTNHPPPQQSPVANPSPAINTFPYRQQPPAGASMERFGIRRDTDREDGEVSEGDVISKSPATKLSDAPRSAPLPPQVPEVTQSASRRRESARGPPSQPQNIGPHDDHWFKALEIINELNKHNVSFGQLVQEGLHPQDLAKTFQALNIPVPDEYRSKPSTASPASATRPANGSSAKLPLPTEPLRLRGFGSALPKPLPVNGSSNRGTSTVPVSQPGNSQPEPAPLKTNIGPSASLKSSPAPSPIDRKDYIARLQAAKAGKSTATKPAPVSNAPTPVDSPRPGTTPAPQAQQPAHSDVRTQTSTPSMSDAEKAKKTELVRQKIAALQASQARGNAKASATTVSKGLRQSVEASTSSIVQSDQQNVGTPTVAVQPGPSLGTVSDVQHQSQSLGKIPGLFMRGEEGDSSATQPERTEPPPLVPRKRPVAADFNEEIKPRTAGPAFTRPLGQSPHEHHDRMIIDVSEDESEGSAMDIEDDGDAPKSVPVISVTNQASQPTNLPSRAASVNTPSSAIPTPPPAATPSTLVSQEHLKKYDLQIAEMKRRIAEKERQKKEKLAAIKSAVPLSPASGSSDTSSVPKPANVSATPNLVQATKASDDLKKDDEPSALRDTPKTDASAWKKQRRAEIESGLPSLEAGLAENRMRLEALRREMEQIEADNRKREQDKQNLIEELERLGIDTEGMPHEELQAKKDEIVQQLGTAAPFQALPTITNEPSAAIPANETDRRIDGPESLHSNELPVQAQHPMPQPIQESAQVQEPMQEPIQEPVFSQNGADANVHSTTNLSDDQLESEADMEMSDSGSMDDAPPMSTEPRQTRLLGYASTAQLNSGAVPNGRPDISESVEEDNIYAIPVELAIKNAELAAEERASTDTSAEQELIGGAMSISSEEEEDAYEPEEPRSLPEHVPLASGHSTDSIPDDRSPTTSLSASSAASTSSSSSEDDDDDEDAYEPPDVSVQPEREPGFSPSADYLNVGSGEAMSAPSVEPGSAQHSGSKDAQDKSTSSNPADVSVSVADVLATQPPSSAVQQLDSSQQRRVSSPDFVPYQSPLRVFKSYRYHPRFTEDVAGGFHSMTYSHQIDPQKPLCSYETAGGACNDPHCDSQHFKDMSLSGDKILVQLGTANPGKTMEERQQWNDGLRSVLKDLRQQNIKEPNVEVVAREIAKFRREFLKDESRVVNI